MKILFAVRLFNGFRSSIETGEWAPWGAPTIFKLIEALDTSAHELEFVFTCKEVLDEIDTSSDRTVRLAGLRNPVTLLGGEARIPSWTGRLRWYLSERRQARLLLRMARESKPNLIYIDRGNLWAASLLARHYPAPLVYRVMGISPSMTKPYAGYRPHQLLNRYQLKAPFKLVICSQDGSGGEFWLDRILDPDANRVLLLNGVDLPNGAGRDPIETGGNGDGDNLRLTKVLFVGRLDPLKGCDEFVSAFLAAWRQAPGELRAVIVGEGKRGAELRSRIAEAGAQNSVTFTGALGHAEVLAHYRQADIYVSLNKMGNLSNANLEAMRSGCCMIVPSPQREIGVDSATADIFPDDTLLRIPRADDIEGLKNAILHLHRTPDERRARGRATHLVAERVIPSWRDRIDTEVRLLESLAAGRYQGQHSPEAVNEFEDRT
jgi:glycosyltransferase involved in cell wall biosynthesis